MNLMLTRDFWETTKTAGRKLGSFENIYEKRAACWMTPSLVKKAEKSGLILLAGGNPAHILDCSLGSHE